MCMPRILISVTGGRSSEHVLFHNACNSVRFAQAAGAALHDIVLTLVMF